MTGGSWVVTGGAGYIGSHVVRALLATGRQVTVIDDLSTGRKDRLPPAVCLRTGSVTDTDLLRQTLLDVAADGVVHLAAKKSPTESMAEPLVYAKENVGGVISLVEAVRDAGVRRVVFSSSCSVYGTPDVERVDESVTTGPESPYGESKLYGERLLVAASAAYGVDLVNLRYFNVVGASEPALADNGLHNLVPLVFRAMDLDEPIKVFGGDYPTPDGTCVRDYVDVQDLADAHVRAAAVLEHRSLCETYNVGRGEGSSVLEVLDTVRAVTGRPLRHQIVARRPGDPARVVGHVDAVANGLGWRSQRDLHHMIASAWAAHTATVKADHD